MVIKKKYGENILNIFPYVLRNGSMMVTVMVKRFCWTLVKNCKGQQEQEMKINTGPEVQKIWSCWKCAWSVF